VLRRTVLQLPLVVALAVGPLAAATPVQAAPGVQHITGEVQLATFSGEAGVRHTIRHADGTWDEFGALTGDRTERNLRSAIAYGEQHLVFDSTPDSHGGGVVQHWVRHADRTWTVLSRTYLPYAQDFAVTGVLGVMHMVRLRPGGRLDHLTQTSDGSWVDQVGVPFQVPSENGSVAVASTGDQLHLLATNAAGTGFISAVRSPDWTWTTPVEVPFTTPLGGVTPSTVDIAQVGDQLHAVVLGGDAQLYHSIRHADGRWDVFNNVGPEAGEPGTPVHVSVTPSRGTLQLAIATSEGGLFHTIRFTDGAWQPFGDVQHEAGSVQSREVTIAGD